MDPRAGDAPLADDSRGGLKPLGQGSSDTWHYLFDQQHTEIFSGGSAGPGKSFTGCLWEITSALKYPGTAGALFRASAEDLRKSTLVTFMEAAQRCGLKPGRDFVFRESKNIVQWVGGSTTQFDYLAYEPRDPNYSRLGGRAYTRAFVDEADQVEDRAVSVLSTRLRYRLTEFCHHCSAQQMAAKSLPVDCDDHGSPILWECYRCKTWTRGLLPKMLLTGNPGDYWTKHRFVYDQDGARINLKPHQACVLMLLEDNPDKAHVATYRAQLEKMDDEYDRQRLLNGDWLIQRRTGREFLHAFRSSDHLERRPYDPDLPLHLSFDFNTAPYMTLLIAQIWQEAGLTPAHKTRWRCHFLAEICLEHPESTTEATCDAFLRECGPGGRFEGHQAGCFIYGDATGKNRTPVVMQGVRHNYDIVEQKLRVHMHSASNRVTRRNPSHGVVRDFCNAYLGGKLALWVTFDPAMTNTTQDMVHVKEAADGGILKVMWKDRATGVTAEKYGHCLQAHYYLTTQAFANMYSKFIRK